MLIFLAFILFDISHQKNKAVLMNNSYYYFNYRMAGNIVGLTN